jgi:hypothetical protein
MLSRLSSFSGPLSPSFRIPVGGFTADGLILRYVINDTNSYSGTTTITDLVGNSNGSLYSGVNTVGIGPTYSINGYLNLDGVNDYVMTNTSLNSKLSPATSSTVISYFTWIYPQDNGVIISEQGVTSLNSSWHYSPIEMVSGSLKFGLWIEPGGVGSISNLTSSIDVPLNNWHYVGLTYDGTTMRTYVNGQSAGTKLITRVAPGTYSNGLYYGIGPTDGTNMGDGTYAKMKFGDFHVYNTALSQQQVLNNYNYTKSNYIYTGSMSIWIDANDPASFSGGSVNDLSGNSYTHSLVATSSTIFGFKSFNCTSASNNYIRVNGTGPLLSTSGYTYVAWARISNDSSTYRTLYRSAPSDHALLVDVGTDSLGFWDNNTNSFKDSGYDVTSIEEKWVQYSVVGDSSSSVFYINDIQVGSVSFGAAGNRHDYFGAIDGQPFGYVGNMMLYNKKLTQGQIKQNYDALKNVYKNGDFVINNIKTALLPSNATSNTTWSTSTGTFSATMTGSPSYNSLGYTFNGTSQYGRIPSASGITDFTNADSYTVEIWFNPSTGQPNPAESEVLEKWNQSNQGRYPYVFRYNENTTSMNVAVYDGTTNPSSPAYRNIVTSGFTTNTWHQIVGVFNFTTDVMSVYKNGALGSTASLPATLVNISNTSPVGIGCRLKTDGTGEIFFKGSIGLIRMYNSALSASDVSKNFEANRGTYGI